MSSSGQKICLANPDGSIKQLSTDANGNLNVNAVGVTLSTTGLAVESGGNLAAIKSDVDKIPAKGTAFMANSTPVTIATDDTLLSAIKVDLDKIPSSPAQENGNLASIKADVDKIPSKGTATMSGSTPVTISTDDTLMAAIKTDLDKIPSSPAQESGNLASIKTDVDKIPSKGTSTMSGATPVTIATDDTMITALKAQLPSALATDGSEKVSDTGLNWKPGLLNTPAAYTTNASYASAISGPLAITRPYSTITVNIKENNVNAVSYQIVGYTEATGFTRPMVLASALPVAKNGTDFQIVTMALLALDVQAVDAVGGTHGSVNVDVVLN